MAIMSMMPLDFLELAPTARLISHDIFLWRWRLRDIMHMEELSLYLFSVNVQGHESNSGFST